MSFKLKDSKIYLTNQKEYSIASQSLILLVKLLMKFPQLKPTN